MIIHRIAKFSRKRHSRLASRCSAGHRLTTFGFTVEPASYQNRSHPCCYAGITIKPGIVATVKLDFRAMPRKQYPANVVGLQIRKLRGKLGLTQEQLAANFQLAGLDISRSTLGQIESRLRYVTDEELMVMAALLGVALEALYPDELLKRYRGKKLKAKVGKSR